MDGSVKRPALIVVGGFPGTGKTTVSRRLAVDLGLPCLAPDAIGETIKKSLGGKSCQIEATRVAYDVLFSLCRDYIRCDVSVILEMTLGWQFHWRFLDEIVQDHPRMFFLPVLLRCEQEVAMRRLRQRYQEQPEKFSPPEFYTTEQKVLDIWDFLQQLQRPDMYEVDASGDKDETYERVRNYMTGRLRK